METTIFTHQQPSVPKKIKNKNHTSSLAFKFTCVKKHKELINAYINSRSFTKKLGKLQILKKLSRSLLTKWFKKMEKLKSRD
jgi:hypothetical protein